MRQIRRIVATPNVMVIAHITPASGLKPIAAFVGSYRVRIGGGLGVGKIDIRLLRRQNRPTGSGKGVCTMVECSLVKEDKIN